MTVVDSWDMPLRTRLLARAVRRWRGGIATLTADEIAHNRTLFTPALPPFTWVTGPVPSSVDIGTTQFTARDGATVAVRTYRPRDAVDDTPALLWFHGGGWVLGSTRGYDPICAWLSHRCAVAVLSVDYRLAPEHRAPQAAHDCIDAVRWVASGSPGDGIRPTGIGLAGDSAGGNLAAVAAHALRSDERADVTYQALIYPAVDATMSSPSVAQHADAPILTRVDMHAYLAHYLGDREDALDPRDPLVSPLHAADHTGSPATLVQTADLDPLRDEGARYAEALRDAGAVVRHTNYARVPHGFMSFPGATRAGAAARTELAGWVAQHARPGSVG